jgi:CubicO group peptidase (beta-lactamase class C family)
LKPATFLLIVGLPVSIHIRARPIDQKSFAESLDRYVTQQLRDRHIASAGVAVVQGNKVLVQKGYGWADLERPLKATPETLYQIGSLTKPFTALAVLLLAEEGKIRLDEPVSYHLPELPQECRAITVRQLLTHTSGINRDLRADNLDDYGEDEFWRRLMRTPMTSQPGEKWEYSNTGYILLGKLIEAVTGQSYGEFLAVRILRPLGMTQTAYLVPPQDTGNRARGYDWEEASGLRRSPYFSGGYAAGGLASSVSDLVKWQKALVTETLLKRSARDQMWKPAALRDGQPVQFSFRGEASSYGFGWFLTRQGNRQLITHGGTVSGFSSIFHYFPSEHLAIIILCNGKSGDNRIGHAETIARGIADAYFEAAR